MFICVCVCEHICKYYFKPQIQFMEIYKSLKIKYFIQWLVNFLKPTNKSQIKQLDTAVILSISNHENRLHCTKIFLTIWPNLNSQVGKFFSNKFSKKNFRKKILWKKISLDYKVGQKHQEYRAVRLPSWWDGRITTVPLMICDILEQPLSQDTSRGRSTKPASLLTVPG